MKKFRLPVVLLLLLLPPESRGHKRHQHHHMSIRRVGMTFRLRSRLTIVSMSCCLVRRTSVVTSQTLSMNEPGWVFLIS